MSNSIHITIEPKILHTLTQGGYSLCVAKILADSSGDVFNVIMASIPQIEPNMIVKWTDVYQIHAASQPFQPGGSVVVTGGLAPMPISFGHSYVVKGWDDPGKIINDPNAPTNGFGFVNDMVCSVVVSTQDPHTKQFIPIYISPESLIAGRELLTPIDKVVLWFEQNMQSATMVSNDKGNSLLVDCTDGPKTVTFKDPGVWVGP